MLVTLLLAACSHPSTDGKSDGAPDTAADSASDTAADTSADTSADSSDSATDTGDGGTDTWSSTPRSAPDDAGDVAFVHNAVAAVLGRPVHGQAELGVLVEIVSTRGRDGLLDALFQEPDFIGYWSRVLTRDFEMDYEDAAGYGSFTECTSRPIAFATRVDPTLAMSLSDHLANDPSNSTFTTSWNMLDGMMASIYADNLLGTWRVWVLTRLAWGVTPGDKRSWVLNNSLIHRPEQCAMCHTSTWGAPDAGVDPALESYGWDRSWPTGLNLDGDVAGGDHTVPLDDKGNLLCDEADRGCVVYRDNCVACHGAAADVPVQSGGVDADPTYRPKVLRDRVPILFDDEIEGTALDGSGRMPSILDRATQMEDAAAVTAWLEARFGRRQDLAEFLDNSRYTSTGTPPFGIHGSCGVLIRADNAAGPVRTYAGQSTTNPTPFVVADALVLGQADLAHATAIEVAVGSDESVSDRRLGGAASFTWMAAESLVDNIFEEVYGAALSTTNGVPRNPVQSAERAASTARFIEAGWSLRTVLRDILLSENFNRLPPTETTQPDPYPMSMIVYPWSDTHRTPDTVTGEGTNGTGDLVHRYSPDHAQWAASRSLGWSQAAYAPDVTAAFGWNTVAFQDAIGALTGPLLRGEDVWTTESLLYWEAVVGSCNADGALGPDWIDRLMQASAADSAATVGDVVEATRDRLIGVPTLSDAELDAFGSLTPALSTPIATSPAAAETILRQWCGALLTSPQFLLTGVPVAMEEATEPAFLVGMPGEPATHEEWCAHYEGALGAMGVEWSCAAMVGDDTAAERARTAPPAALDPFLEAEAARRLEEAVAAARARRQLHGPRHAPMPAK